MKLTLAATALVALGLLLAGCADSGQWPPNLPVQTPKVKTPSSNITAEDKAILAVYVHLVDQARAHKAKLYLADFYTVCDQWSAKSEVLKDGTKIWYVTVDMTGAKTWGAKPYWKQACWLGLEDGRIVPSSRFQANALRIEADLQELSLPAKQ